MRTSRIIAAVILTLVGVLSIGADLFSPYDYAVQFREHANEPPSGTFPLGTDDLGRDRLSRLLHGSRVSLLCAPAAALVSVGIATLIGLFSGHYGGWVDKTATAATDLFLSLPWLFALLTVRALLPLHVSPWGSVAVTFLMLAVVGWASVARVVRATVAGMRGSGSILHARSSGCRTWRVMCFQMVPMLRPILSAQFWILVPVFLLAESNLGVLGLGVTEPLPSWGGMLADLQNYQRIPESPWILAPAALLVLVVASLHFIVSGDRRWE